MIVQLFYCAISIILFGICKSDGLQKVLIDGGYIGFLDKEKYGIKCDEKYEGRCIHKFKFDHKFYNRKKNIRDGSIVFYGKKIQVKHVELKYIDRGVTNNNLLVHIENMDLIKPDTIKIQFNNSNIDCINYNVLGDVLSCTLTTKISIKENVKLYLNYSYIDEVPPLEIGVELLNLEVDRNIPSNQNFLCSNISYHVRNNNLFVRFKYMDLIKPDTIKIQFNNSNIDCINYNVSGDVLSCILTTKKSIKENVKLYLNYSDNKNVSRLEIGIELLNLEVDRDIPSNQNLLYYIIGTLVFVCVAELICFLVFYIRPKISKKHEYGKPEDSKPTNNYSTEHGELSQFIQKTETTSVC